MLEITDLGSQLFGPISLRLESGDCVALRGASGAGKSVLLRAIADLDPVDGRVTLNGQTSSAMTGAAWRAKVALVPAQPGWWADQVQDHFEPIRRDDAIGLMESLGLPAQAWGWDVERLSSGEAQRLAIVRAVINRPDVLLLDEPTASLDEEATRLVEKLLTELQDAGRALLVVTHDANQAQRIARRRYVISGGRLHEQ